METTGAEACPERGRPTVDPPADRRSQRYRCREKERINRLQKMLLSLDCKKTDLMYTVSNLTRERNELLDILSNHQCRHLTRQASVIPDSINMATHSPGIVITSTSATINVMDADQTSMRSHARYSAPQRDNILTAKEPSLDPISRSISAAAVSHPTSAIHSIQPTAHCIPRAHLSLRRSSALEKAFGNQRIKTPPTNVSGYGQKRVVGVMTGLSDSSLNLAPGRRVAPPSVAQSTPLGPSLNAGVFFTDPNQRASNDGLLNQKLKEAQLTDERQALGRIIRVSGDPPAPSVPCPPEPTSEGTKQFHSTNPAPVQPNMFTPVAKLTFLSQPKHSSTSVIVEEGRFGEIQPSVRTSTAQWNPPSSTPLTSTDRHVTFDPALTRHADTHGQNLISLITLTSPSNQGFVPMGNHGSASLMPRRVMTSQAGPLVTEASGSRLTPVSHLLHTYDITSDDMNQELPPHFFH